MTDTAEALRIIAKDALRGHDRETVRIAADELDATQQQLVATQQALIESQARRIAVNERLIEAQRGWSGGSGPLTFRFLPVTRAHWNI